MAGSAASVGVAGIARASAARAWRHGGMLPRRGAAWGVQEAFGIGFVVMAPARRAWNGELPPASIRRRAVPGTERRSNPGRSAACTDRAPARGYRRVPARKTAGLGRGGHPSGKAKKPRGCVASCVCRLGSVGHAASTKAVVPRRGLEPPHLAAHGPEPCASTNSATWALSVSASVSLFAIRCVSSRGARLCTCFLVCASGWRLFAKYL